MSSTSTFSTRLTKLARGKGDATRQAYVVGRRLLEPASFLARRRAARRARPPEHVAVPDADGFRIFAPGTFPEADEAAQECRRLLDRSEEVLRERRKVRKDKQFLVNLLPASSLTAAHPLIRLALRPDLLESVMAYLGTVPMLRTIQVFYSGAVDREPVSSQLYHCDADDVRQLKIFLLCSEVRRENGPLTMLSAEASERIRRRTGYEYGDRLTDEQVAQVLGPHQPAELVGTVGTSCIVDTSRCFHFGSRVEAGAAPRLVAMIQYLSPFAFVVPFGSTGPFAHLAQPQHTPLQRAFLTGDHHHL